MESLLLLWLLVLIWINRRQVRRAWLNSKFRYFWDCEKGLEIDSRKKSKNHNSELRRKNQINPILTRRFLLRRTCNQRRNSYKFRRRITIHARRRGEVEVVVFSSLEPEKMPNEGSRNYSRPGLHFFMRIGSAGSRWVQLQHKLGNGRSSGHVITSVFSVSSALTVKRRHWSSVFLLVLFFLLFLFLFLLKQNFIPINLLRL